VRARCDEIVGRDRNCAARRGLRLLDFINEFGFVLPKSAEEQSKAVLITERNLMRVSQKTTAKKLV
jgi:hypothetical protein